MQGEIMVTRKRAHEGETSAAVSYKRRVVDSIGGTENNESLVSLPVSPVHCSL